MIIFSRNEELHILVLNTYANNISFLSKGQQVVAQLEDRICPQVVDDFRIIVHLRCTTNSRSVNLKSSLSSIGEIDESVGAKK